jgi:capsid protein
LTGETGTGKLLFFEADQITNLTEEDFKAFIGEAKEREAWTQESGILRDEYGRKCGVICAKTRGVPSVARKDALILTCDPDTPEGAPWRHIARKFRLRQLRGVPDAFAAIQSACDTYEILGYELQSAKEAAAHYAAIIEGEDAAQATATGFDDSEPTEEEEREEAEEEEETISADGLQRYCGGDLDIFPHGTTVSFDSPQRPNNNLPGFLDFTGDLTGLAFGLWHSIARGRSDSSYTSFRGDVVQTALTFRDFQQWLEDAFSDWVARSTISRAVALGILEAPPEGWEKVIAWQYPTVPEIDASKEASARAQRYRSKELTLRETLGPAWREQIEQIAEERNLMRKLGLRHPSEETASGQIIDTNKEARNNGEDNQD